MATCRSCEAPITWAVTEGGKRMPLDDVPSERGNIVYVNGVTRAANAVDRDLKRPLYTSHFATCPNAKQHRRPR